MYAIETHGLHRLLWMRIPISTRMFKVRCSSKWTRATKYAMCAATPRRSFMNCLVSQPLAVYLYTGLHISHRRTTRPRCNDATRCEAWQGEERRDEARRGKATWREAWRREEGLRVVPRHFPINPVRVCPFAGNDNGRYCIGDDRAGEWPQGRRM